MTTVAVRAGVMAADSAYTVGGLRLPAGACGPKIYRLANGWLVSFAGSQADDERIKAWLESDGVGEVVGEASEHTNGLVLKPDQTIWGFDGAKPTLYRYYCEFMAVGSGEIAAMAAMHADADAARAVEIAALCDRCTELPVQVERL